MSKKITELTEATSLDNANDWLVAVDVSDTTQSASGTNKKIKPENLGLGSSLTAKTGTSIVFTENAEYYADGSYNPNTSGDITLSLTGAVDGTGVVVSVEGYAPNITGEDYIILSDTSNGVRDIYYFYKAFDGIKLNIIGESVLTAPVVTLTPGDEEIQVDWTLSVNATSYTVLRNTTNTTVGATTIYTGALLTYTDTGLTNGTTYYYFVQATGAEGRYDSIYGTNSDAPEAYPATAFVINVDTTTAGASASDQFIFPTQSDGTYNCTVDWGDGNSDVITTWNDAAWTHTYTAGGTYRIIITGTSFERLFFNGGGDGDKIDSIEQWGLFKLADSSGDGGRTFQGCSNLLVTATDAPDLTSCTSLTLFWYQCTSLTTVPNIDTWASSGVTNWTGFFRGCTVFDQDISGLDISGAVTINTFLYQASAFNSALPTVATPNVTTWQSFLSEATSFNQDISVLDFSNGGSLQTFLDDASSFNHVSIESIDVSACDDFDFMLRDTTALDRSLANWDVRNATAAIGFMDNTSISQANYDATLIGWDTRTGYNSLNWDFGSSQYTAAGAGGTARTSLIGKGLTFTDVAN